MAILIHSIHNSRLRSKDITSKTRTPPQDVEPQRAYCKSCEWESEDVYTRPLDIANATKAHSREAHPELYESSGQKRKKARLAADVSPPGNPNDGTRPAADDGEVNLSKPPIKAKNPTVRVTFRPQVFELDEVVVTLYHQAMAAIQEDGVDYHATVGEWIRDVVFRYHIEHREILDLSLMLTPEEKQAILGGAPV
ncbi:MAG: hypothetical protein Q8P59_11270 [Dehalococcoidia bacterium]|nr:hypothetical protein [Dehalococcoidia bacterium]